MSKKTDGKLDSMVESAILQGYSRKVKGRGAAVTDELPDACGLATAGEFIEGVFAGFENCIVREEPRTLGVFVGPGAVQASRKDGRERIPVVKLLAKGEEMRLFLGHQVHAKLKKVALGSLVSVERTGEETELDSGHTLAHYDVEVLPS